MQYINLLARTFPWNLSFELVHSEPTHSLTFLCILLLNPFVNNYLSFCCHKGLFFWSVNMLFAPHNKTPQDDIGVICSPFRYPTFVLQLHYYAHSYYFAYHRTEKTLLVLSGHNHLIDSIPQAAGFPVAQKQSNQLQKVV